MGGFSLEVFPPIVFCYWVRADGPFVVGIRRHELNNFCIKILVEEAGGDMCFGCVGVRKVHA